jgi:hypothetical protein
MELCRASASQRSLLRLRRDPASGRNVLKWKVVRGGNGSRADIRDPVGGNPSLAVCLYDASAAAQPLLASGLLPGGTCGAKPCWKRLAGDGGYRYRSQAATPDGISLLKLRLSRGGELQLLVKGKGGNLPLPPLGLRPPVRVQLLIEDLGATTCWDSSFTSAIRNDPTIFRANGS